MTNRRSLVLAGVGCFPLGLLAQRKPAAHASGKRLRAGEDRFGEDRTIGVSTAKFKVSTGDTQGALFAMEHKHTRKGGPARHLHLNEDEWFYVLEGEYWIEVGGDGFTIGPGDSVLVPRRTPHAYAFQGNGVGRLLLTFSPAGKMEESFRAFKDRGGNYSRWDSPDARKRARQFGMELLGPPLSI